MVAAIDWQKSEMQHSIHGLNYIAGSSQLVHIASAGSHFLSHMMEVCTAIRRYLKLWSRPFHHTRLPVRSDMTMTSCLRSLSAPLQCRLKHKSLQGRIWARRTMSSTSSGRNEIAVVQTRWIIFNYMHRRQKSATYVEPRLHMHMNNDAMNCRQNQYCIET
jgi:hypothetical protein